MKKISAMLLGDIRNIRRDPFLLMLLAVPPFLALLVRLGIPFAAEKLRDLVDLRPHFPFITGLLLFFPGMLFGAVTGFLLLDERDEGILNYMSVTPLTAGGYLRYRLLLPTLAAALSTALLLPPAAIVPLPLLQLTAAIPAAALTTPIPALLLAALAGNKVEGMAIYKLSGLLLAGPAVAWFVSGPWSLCGAFLPGWWVMQIFIHPFRDSMSAGISIPGAFLCSAAWILLLGRLYRRKNR